jgi:MATE family multidrug resistance protein
MKFNKEVFRLAIPNIISNVSVPLISSVDTALMGHQSTSNLAAVAASSMIFNFLYWNFGFLRMGTTGLVAQAYGRNDDNERSRVFFQAVLISLIISSLLLILQVPLGFTAMKLMNLEGDLVGLASEYYNVRIWDAPATLMIYIIMAWFFGNQNAFIPLLLTIVINIVNIVTSVIFVRYMDMGIGGVALGSVIGNYAGLFVGLIAIAWKMPVLWGMIKDLKSGFLRFFQVNKDIFIRTVMLSCTFFMLYSQSVTFGELPLAVMAIMLQFINWMSYAIDGFAYACESLVGKYVGAKNEAKLKQTIADCFIYAAIFALLFSIAYGVFTPQLSKVFTSDSSVIDYLISLRWWLFLIPLVGFPSYIWDGIFVGLTASKAMRNTMALSFGFFLSTYYGTKNLIGFESLILGLVVYLIARAIAQNYLYFKKGIKLS